MVHTYEFELYPTGGSLSAMPFDFEGEVKGRSRAEVSHKAVSLLRREIEQRLDDIRTEKMNLTKR